MLPYVAAAVVGAIFMQKKRPATDHKKRSAIGPKTGIVYEVDDFPKAGVIFVKAPDGTQVSFKRREPPAVGFEFVKAVGNPRVVEILRRDFSEE